MKVCAILWCGVLCTLLGVAGHATAAVKPVCLSMHRAWYTLKLIPPLRDQVCDALAAHTENEAIALREHVVANAVQRSLHVPFIPYWFERVDSGEDALALAERYDVPLSYLEEKNPGVALEALDSPTRILLYRRDPTRPSASVGSASRGHIQEAMPMPTGEQWVVRNHARAWATARSVHWLAAGLIYVGKHYPGGSSVLIGDMSRQVGGRMKPHRSHQSGRDADVTYYVRGHQPDTPIFWNAESEDLDLARTWALFRFWIRHDLVEFIFVDRRIQERLAAYAYSVTRDREFVWSIFETEGGRQRSIIRHEPGHTNHFHVRFRCSSHDMNCK